MTTPIPGAYDPTAGLRDLYRDAETQLLRVLARAVADTIAHPEQRVLIDLRVQQQTRRIIDRLTPQVMAEVDAILDTAPLEGRQRADND